MKNYWTKQNNIFYQTLAWLVLVTLLGSMTAPLTGYADEGVKEPLAVVVEDPPAEPPEATEEITVPENSDGDEVLIETGDATAALESESEINTNETATALTAEENEEKPTEDKVATNEAESLPPEAETVLFEFIDNETDSTTVKNDNEATSTTEAATTADTGGNIAISGGSATINTGDAVAYADIVNVVNTNITNSAGLIDFVNDVLGYEDFDLTDEFITAFSSDTAVSTPTCTLSACQDNSVDMTVVNENDATINNNVTVVASSGGNAAAGSETTVTTGDAYASANIINVANTNITDSNYLLLVFNNFDSYAGDIILPNSSFFNDMLAGDSGVNDLMVENTNTVNVTNNVSVTANTGNNNATGDSSTITTGSALSTGAVTNLLNTNITGGTSFSILIRVNGEWSGDIYGLPDGMSWARTPEGVRVFTTGTSGGNRLTSADTVLNTNRATINNNVRVYALTGDNEAVGDEVTLKTGNAHAEASVINIANTNIVGSNWANLIFNIYGSWSGNLTFGQPDLWLGVRASSADSPIMPGSLVTYTYTVFNGGDVPASNVLLESVVDGGLLKFSTTDTFQSSQGRDYSGWQIGTVAPGATRELTYTARVSELIPAASESIIPLLARVSSQQSDANPDDNEDRVDVYVGHNHSNASGRSGTINAKLNISKLASTDVVAPGDTVHYTIRLFNRGGKLYDAALTDVLEDSEGNVIAEHLWPINDFDTHETITIEYDTTFAKDAELGKYTNYAQVVGMHGSTKPKYQQPYYSALATHEITISNEPSGEVLGLSTTACPAYLTTYLRYGIDNEESQVRKLQVFLNQYDNANLLVSGTFDLPTEVAVRIFQREHATDILDPWGLQQDSGYVYYTTQKKINELVCENQVSFPLTNSQQQEISVFRERFGFTTPRREESTPTSQPETLPTATLDQRTKLFTWAESAR